MAGEHRLGGFPVVLRRPSCTGIAGPTSTTTPTPSSDNVVDLDRHARAVNRNATSSRTEFAPPSAPAGGGTSPGGLAVVLRRPSCTGMTGPPSGWDTSAVIQTTRWDRPGRRQRLCSVCLARVGDCLVATPSPAAFLGAADRRTRSPNQRNSAEPLNRASRASDRR